MDDERRPWETDGNLPWTPEDESALLGAEVEWRGTAHPEADDSWPNPGVPERDLILGTDDDPWWRLPPM